MPENDIIVRCQICYANIARISPDEEPPWHGDQFRPLYEDRHIPPPFRWDAPWVDIRCPVCNKRPFLSPNRLWTEDKDFFGYEHGCEICGEYFRTHQALNGHKNKHLKR